MKRKMIEVAFEALIKLLTSLFEYYLKKEPEGTTAVKYSSALQKVTDAKKRFGSLEINSIFVLSFNVFI